jgi:uncharacterized protein YjbI with pentapeptide repeats
MIKKILLTLFALTLTITAYNPAHLKYLLAHNNCPNCDLTNVFLQGFTATGANFDGADLSGASFSGARLPYASFNNSKLIGTIFNQAILTGAKFNRANLTNAQLVNSYLKEASFHKSTLVKSNFFWARAPEANFTQAQFLDTIFKRTDLYRANLLNAKGNMIIDYCAGQSPSKAPCADTICSYKCTNFCCTTMPDGTIKTDKLNPLCSWDKRRICSID